MRHSKSQSVSLPVVSSEAGEIGSQRRTRRLEAFAPRFRADIADLALASQQLEDLAESFPALLFAIATGYGTAPQRRAALKAVNAGRSLREAAGQIGLPMWMRRLPPIAFHRRLKRIPTDPALTNRLQTLIPQQPGAVAAWLDRVLTAFHTGRADLTLWVAQHYRGSTPAAATGPFLRVLAWAWFSTQPELPGARLLATRWTPETGIRRAHKEAALWRERIALDVCLGQGLEDSWLLEGTAGGFDFVALRTADDFIAEANAMDNCLDRYADRLMARTVRIFSIRRDGRSIANAEIAPHEHEAGIPTVAQLRAPRNRRAPFEVWQATYAWLGSQPIRLAEPHLEIKATRAEQRRRLDSIWRPFLNALPENIAEHFEDELMPSRRQTQARRPRVQRRAAPRADLDLGSELTIAASESVCGREASPR